MLCWVISPTPPAQPSPGPPARVPSRRFLAWEVVLVLGVSLGRSAVYAILQLAERLAEAPLAEQTATVHSSRSRHELFDLTYQVLDSIFALVPVALVLYLMFLHGVNPFRRFGLDLRRPRRDLALGAGLFLLIGAGTLVVYVGGRTAGVTMEIIPADVTAHWWTTPTLLIAAVRHALVEEVIMVAYLLDRARRLWPGLTPSWVRPESSLQAAPAPAGHRAEPRDAAPAGLPRLGRLWWVVVAAALLRGAYHLYQGFGPGLGNALMGVVFGAVYLRYGRVMPLVIAHFLLDAVAFLAFPLVLRLTGVSALIGG